LDAPTLLRSFAFKLTFFSKKAVISMVRFYYYMANA
jgi:hypothetical protein